METPAGSAGIARAADATCRGRAPRGNGVRGVFRVEARWRERAPVVTCPGGADRSRRGRFVREISAP